MRVILYAWLFWKDLTVFRCHLDDSLVFGYPICFYNLIPGSWNWERTRLGKNKMVIT